MVRRRRVRNTCAPRAFAEREALQAALFDEGAPGPDQGFSQPAMVVMAGLSFHPRFCPRRTPQSDRYRRHIPCEMLTKS
jgi:hypothetical protein